MEIQVTVEGVTQTLTREKYVQLKHQGLVEFGYDNLTLAEVEQELDGVLEGKTFGNGITIIGMFIQRDNPIMVQKER